MARTAYLPVAAVLTALMLAVSFVPIAGRLAPGAWHWIAHFGAFAILAFLWRRALPRAPALGVAAAVVAFGFAQEALEIAGHVHGFELADALVDAAGAAAGIAAAQVSFRLTH